MTPRGLILLGSLVALAAVLLALLGASLQGSLNPACAGRPLAQGCLEGRDLAGYALKVIALPVGILGGILVAVGLGRRAALEDEEGPEDGRT